MQRAGAQNLRESFPQAAPLRLLATLDSLRAAITIFDPDARLVYLNAHLNHIFHSLPPHQSLIGKSYEELIRLELPEIASDCVSDGVENFIARRLTQLAVNAWAPQDIRLTNGHVIEIKARRDDEGYVILLWNDVTDARHQFARLEEAIKLSADAFAFFDGQDRFITGNELYAQLVGASLESLRGQAFESIITRAAEGGHLALTPTTFSTVRRLVPAKPLQPTSSTRNSEYLGCFTPSPPNPMNLPYGA